MAAHHYRLTEAGPYRFLTNPFDMFVGKSLEIYGEWSGGEIGLLTQLLRKGQHVIEVGSNIGSHAVPLANHVGPIGQVFAFEPQRLSFQLLCANAALNGFINIHARQMAVSDAPRRMRLAQQPADRHDNFGMIGLPESESGEFVQVVTLDQLIDEFPPIALIKADVEGLETEVLKGAARLIRRDRPAIYVESEHPDRSEEMIRLLWSLNYDCWFQNVPLFATDNPARTTWNVFGDIVSCNMLALPRDKSFDIKGAEKISDATAHPRKKGKSAT